MGWCYLCPGPVDDRDLLDHIRSHPDAYGDEIERWPDGELVIDDSEVLEPEDFR